MKRKTKRFLQRCQFFGVSSALVLALWLATAIASPAQTFNVLASFSGTDGANPSAGLVQGADGNLYGTTADSGANGAGTVFKITPGGTLTMLYSFCPKTGCTDGLYPYPGLVLATDGNFYGITTYGGVYNSACFYSIGCGTVFKISPRGELTTLYSFCAQPGCTDGARPLAGLIQATDGNFYGTTFYGGANCVPYGCGTVFKITPAGTLTTLHSFCSQTNCADGNYPYLARILQGTDGNFYGATGGTVFKITPAGTLTTLHSFCSQKNCADGQNPYGGVIQATDGDLYGTTNSFGAHGGGTAFKMTTRGALTTLYSFCAQPGCTDGARPLAGLIQATDGNFYGTTWEGGANSSGCNGTGCGTIFRITPSGTLTPLYSFCSQANCGDGAEPWAGLLQATNGTFYGTTSGGGAYGDGTVFGLSMSLGPFVAFVRDSGKVGWTAEVLGQGFTGTSGVSFNGTPAAKFTIKRDTYLIATVPAGATTGPVTVTTPGGTLTSNVPYRVRPTILSFSPTSGTVGTQVTITGVSLTQTTKVAFNGTPTSSFTVNSDTQVTATVPKGAHGHGPIAITTAGGKTWSQQTFTVTP